MRNNILIFIVLAAQLTLHAQFNKIIFKQSTTMYNDQQDVTPHVLGLGDQNHDGYDDILIINAAQKKAMIFYGGNPMDTIPKYSFIIDTTYRQILALAAIDLNDDGDKDIVISYIKDENTANVKIYYGGKNFDTIPYVLPKPAGASLGWGSNIYTMKDFNGDRRSELIITDSNIPYSSHDSQYGAWYIYNTGKTFDPKEYKIITGDSAKGIQLLPDGAEFGDLNGDGLTDMSLLYFQNPVGSGQLIRVFIPGNKNWDFAPVTTFRQKEHNFDVRDVGIINDFNGDKKDDILISSYGNKYDSWVTNSILYGSMPVDTIQDVGINTSNTGISSMNSISPGDVNGDGYNDILGKTQEFGNRGVKLYLGGKNKTIVDPVQSYYGESEAGLGRMIAKVGDVNGDGLADICIASTRYDMWEYNSPSVVYIFSGEAINKDTTTAVKDKNGKNAPDNYELYQPYPNPFNPSVTINYRLGERASVTIKVFDLLGKEITTLVNEEKGAGSYKLNFNADKYRLSSGIYFLEIKTSGVNSVSTLYHKVVKMLYLR